MEMVTDAHYQRAAVTHRPTTALAAAPVPPHR